MDLNRSIFFQWSFSGCEKGGYFGEVFTVFEV